MSTTPQTSGYSRLSIATHWLTAIFVIVLFVTHEGENGDIASLIHVGGGAIVGLFLLWRVWHRIRKGMTTVANQAMILNLASKAVMWGFLISIVVVTITGYLLPWTKGAALDIFGLFSIPSPIATNYQLHGLMEELHEISGHAFPILLILHVLGAAKHLFIDRDGIVARMLRPLAGGR